MLWFRILKLLSVYSKTGQMKKYIEENTTIREDIYKNGKRKIRMCPLLLDWHWKYLYIHVYMKMYMYSYIHKFPSFVF